MSTTIIKRTIDGCPVLFPALDPDFKKMSKIPDETRIKIITVTNRKHRTNSSLWACCEFVAHPYNCPEHIIIGSAEDLYDVLLLEIGWCSISKINGKIQRTPKPTNFVELPNEAEYIEKVHTPAMRILCELTGHATEYDLIQSSATWKNMKKEVMYQ